MHLEWSSWLPDRSALLHDRLSRASEKAHGLDIEDHLSRKAENEYWLAHELVGLHRILKVACCCLPFYS